MQPLICHPQVKEIHVERTILPVRLATCMYTYLLFYIFPLLLYENYFTCKSTMYGELVHSPLACIHQILDQGWTLVSLYVGMVRKQDGCSNGCISNYTTITQLKASIMYVFWSTFLSFSIIALANETGNITWQQCQGSKAATTHPKREFLFSSSSAGLTL